VATVTEDELLTIVRSTARSSTASQNVTASRERLGVMIAYLPVCTGLTEQGVRALQRELNQDDAKRLSRVILDDMGR